MYCSIMMFHHISFFPSPPSPPPSVSPEKRKLPRHYCCVLSRLCQNGHNSYLPRIGKIKNPFCAYDIQTLYAYRLILLCCATDFLRRSLFSDSLSISKIKSRPWGISLLLWPHCRSPCPISRWEWVPTITKTTINKYCV